MRERKIENEIPITETLKDAFSLMCAVGDEEKEWGKKNLQSFHKELKAFIRVFLEMSLKLPETPRRGYEPSKDWIAMARAEHQPLSRSWGMIRTWLNIYARILWEPGDPKPRAWSLLAKEGLFWKDAAIISSGGYTRFIRLRSWLFRRSSKGKKKQKEYEKDRAASRKRPSKEAEAARKKAAYWRKKEETQKLPSLMVEYDTPDGLPWVEEAPMPPVTDEEFRALLETV